MYSGRQLWGSEAGGIDWGGGYVMRKNIIFSLLPKKGGGKTWGFCLGWFV